MVEIIAIIVLGLVCVGQALERYFYGKDMTQKLNDSIKAVMSRNINEYMAAVTVDKKTPSEFAQPDEIYLDVADDETFDKVIQQQTQ